MSITCTLRKTTGLKVAAHQKKPDLKSGAGIQHSWKSKYFPNATGRVSNRNSCCNGVLRGNSGEGPHATLNSTFVETEESFPDTYPRKTENDHEAEFIKTDPDEEFGCEEEKHRVAAIILGGGTPNSTTYPLVMSRAKPAVPLGANYRLIDIPISNCINSDLSRIFVLTQYNSLSLNQHLARAYPPRFFEGCGGSSFVEVLAAQQTPNCAEWGKGSADAVRQHLTTLTSDRIPSESFKNFFIIPGEQLYRMNYSKLLDEHIRSGADITVSTILVRDTMPALRRVDGSGLGVLVADDDGKVSEFHEKPDEELLERLRYLSSKTTPEKPYLASMGLYVFTRKAIMELLNGHPDLIDFGKDVLPFAVKNGYNVRSRLFGGYWRDVTTLRAFLQANLALARFPPPFRFYDRSSPIYTQSRNLPPLKIEGECSLVESLIGEGCCLTEATVIRSVVGSGQRLFPGVRIEDSYLMGADPYALDKKDNGLIPLGVGENTLIRNAIVDRNVRIGKNVRIENKEGIEEANRSEDGYYISSGIVTILKGATIPENFEC